MQGRVLSFQVLGPLQVVDAGGPVTPQGLKEQTLLAHLVARVDHTVSVDDLVESMWGGRPPQTAAKALQNHVLRLRNLLEPGRGPSPEVLVTDPGGYRLAVPDDWVDARRFERMTDLGRRAFREGRTASAAATLADALTLWRGRAYAGLDGSPVLAAEARRLTELRTVAQEDRIAADLDLGRAGEVVSETEALVAADPLRERSWELRVLALYRSGRQGDALAALRDVRQVLDEQLGVQPGPALRRLQARVLAHDPDLDVTAQVVLPESLVRPPGRLVGRARELAALEGLWQQVVSDGQPRTVLLRGPAGVGVGRLAAELASEVADQGFPVALGDGRPEGADRPTLRVVDRRRSGRVEPCELIATGPLLTVQLDPAGATGAVPDGAEVVELTPLAADDVRLLLADYLEPTDAQRVLPEVMRLSGGRPGRVHDEALAVARRLATAQVSGSVARVTNVDRQLGSLRDDLRDQVAWSRELSELTHPLDPDVCPWKGLAPYTTSDADAYAGRERLTAELLSRVATARLVTVIGSSGCGKSSLVSAGLLASLEAGALPGSEHWSLLRMRPWRRPTAELARVALQGGVPPLDDIAEALERTVFGDSLGGHLVLVVDQLEEVWTACQDEDERQAFLDALTEVVTGTSRTTVVLVCRADHAGRLADHAGLAPLVPPATVLVGVPSAAELRRAIERPAQRAGLRLEDGLVDALVDDAGDEPGVLPLLSTCLTELWDRRQGRTLTLAAYAAIGGLRGSVARVAERAYGALDAPVQKAARVLLLRLAGPGEGSAVTRRRVTVAELASLPDPHVREAVEPLADARLLTVREGTVEVAHEALFREWPRLCGWLEEDATVRAVARRLTASAAEWEDAGRDPVELWRGARLDAGLDLLTHAPERLTAVEREFLESGRALQLAEQQEAEQRAASAARQNRRLRWLVAGIGVLLVAALVAVGVAATARSEAEQSARVAKARELAAASSARLETDPELAVLLATAAVSSTRDTSGEVLPEAVSALHHAVTRLRVLQMFTGSAGGILDWSPDGSMVVSEGPEGTGIVDVRDAETGESLRSWTGHEIDVNEVFFAANGTLLTAGDDGTLAAWDPRTGDELGRVRGPDGSVFYASASADGRTMAGAWTDDGTVLVGSVGSEEPPRQVDVGGRALAPTLDPTGRRLAVGVWRDDGADVVVLDVATSQELVRMHNPDRSYVETLRFSPDGRWLAATGFGPVRVWDAETGALSHSFTGHRGRAVGLDWSQDSTLLATGGDDGTARVWDMDGGGAALPALAAAGTSQGILGVAFDPTATRLLAGDFRTEVATMFDVRPAGSREWATVVVGAGGLADASFTPDGHLVTTGIGGGVQQVDARTGEPVGPTEQLAQGPVAYRVQVSGDGTRALVSGHERVAVLELATGALLDEWEAGPFETQSGSWSADGEVVAIGGTATDGTLVADASGRSRFWLQESPGFHAIGAAMSADGTRVATARAPRGANINKWGVTIWDATTGVAMLTVDEHGQSLAFSPDGSVLAVADPFGPAVLLEASTGRRLAVLTGHLGGVASLAYSPDGSRLATGGYDGTVRVWDTSTGTSLLVVPAHEGAVWSVEFSPDASMLASAGDDALVRVWAMAVDDLLGIASDRVTRSLTDDECAQYLAGEGC